MRSLRFDTAAFINEYHQAKEAGMTQEDLAELLGITYSQLCNRKHVLKKRGIRLPALRRKGGSGRRAAKPVLRLLGPVETLVEPAPLSFVITVGADNA